MIQREKQKTKLIPIVEPDLLTEDMMTNPKPSFAFLVTITSCGPRNSFDFEVEFSV